MVVPMTAREREIVKHPCVVVRLIMIHQHSHRYRIVSEGQSSLRVEL